VSRFRCEGSGRLQEVSGNTEEATKGSSGASNGLVTSTGESSGLSGGWDNNGASWGGGWGNNWYDGSDVRVWDYWGDSWLVADSAWAVGDGDGLGSSGSVSLAIEGERGGIWADRGENINGRGNPGLIGPGRGGSSQRSNDGELCELHFDGFGWY